MLTAWPWRVHLTLPRPGRTGGDGLARAGGKAQVMLGCGSKPAGNRALLGRVYRCERYARLYEAQHSDGHVFFDGRGSSLCMVFAMLTFPGGRADRSAVLRVGITQSNMSTPIPIAVQMSSGVPTTAGARPASRQRLRHYAVHHLRRSPTPSRPAPAPRVSSAASSAQVAPAQVPVRRPLDDAEAAAGRPRRRQAAMGPGGRPGDRGLYDRARADGGHSSKAIPQRGLDRHRPLGSAAGCRRPGAREHAVLVD